MTVSNIPTPQKQASAFHQRRYSILAAVMFSGIVAPIDASIVNVTLPTIAGFFKVNIATAQWVPMIYLLTLASLLLFYGRLGEILGYKKVYLAGLAGFIVASALCGLSPGIYWLIVFRAFQGLAAGALFAVPYAIITASFPAEERGKAMGLNALSISVGLAAGPSLGGFITSWLGWQFVFLINIPIGIAGLIWAWRVVPEIKGQPGKMDVAGAVTAFVALFSFLLFVNRFQISLRSGFSGAPGALLVVAAVSAVCFIFIERRSRQPMLDLRLFSNKQFSFNSLSGMLNFMSQYIMVFLTPFYLLRVLKYSSGDAGLIMTAFPLAVMAMAPFSGSISDRIGARAPTFVGAGLCSLALVMMSILPDSSGPAEIVWRLALFGLGTGIFQSPNHSVVMGSVPKPRLGIASGILATMRSSGMVLGVATGAFVLYAFSPQAFVGMPAAAELERASFAGLPYAYLAGAILTGAAAVTSLVKGKQGIRQQASGGMLNSSGIE